MLFFLAAMVIRLAHFQNEPITDELYHLLAAQSWAENGSLAIADGEYRRAWGFTKLVGLVYWMTEGNVDAIRIVCIAIGALLVAVVFAWTALNAGLLQAISAAGLLAILPGAVFLSQYIRFYSLHALIFFLLAWCAWAFARSDSGRFRLLTAGIGGLLAIVGTHLQPTTLVGLAGIFTWLLIIRGRRILAAVPKTGHRLAIAGALVIAGLVVLVLFRDTFAALLQTYRASALWNSSDNALYYHNLYRDELGFLWSFAPAAFVLAMLARPKPAFFCATIFVVAFVIQSFGGMRSERFLFYALPFFFVLWGIAACAAGTALRAAIDSALRRASPPAVPMWARQWTPPVLVAVIAGFALITLPVVETSGKMFLGRKTSPPEYWDRYRTNWSRVMTAIRPIAEEAEAVVVSQPLHAIWYLGDFDFALNATTLADISDPMASSAIDPRTGRWVFNDRETMRQIMACFGSGIVVVHAPAWRNDTRVGDAVADVVEAHAAPVDLPVRSDLLVWRWTAPLPGVNCNPTWQSPPRPVR